MRKDKEKAILLRKTGKSYVEIHKELGVAKSTFQSGLKFIHKNLYRQARIEANEEFDDLKYHPLFIAAIMIYWGEGDKISRSRVSVVNTEPAMLGVFVYSLKNICAFEDKKIRAWILAYPDMDIITSRQYWIEKTGLSESNFRNTITIQGKSNKRRLQNGVCTIELSSTYFKTKMLVWLRRFSEELVRGEYYAGII